MHTSPTSSSSSNFYSTTKRGHAVDRSSSRSWRIAKSFPVVAGMVKWPFPAASTGRSSDPYFVFTIETIETVFSSIYYCCIDRQVFLYTQKKELFLYKQIGGRGRRRRESAARLLSVHNQYFNPLRSVPSARALKSVGRTGACCRASSQQKKKRK